ncbi:riboflavin synthase subunit beta [Ulvibacterium marinum]|uniref:riboflavin synthase subunit beta n=1 Tax=Ulvibacterium marinum TaxID=2419782 RepID=UPI001B8786E3|nr:riboflavin synthase subunit beta [Ulvibacterium marinum]
MGFIGKFTKLRKNKEFGYQPRYYNDKGEGSPFKLENRFDKYRTTVNTPRGLKGKFRSVKEDMQRSGDRHIKTRMAVIIAVLVLIFLYIIDFDLSIFFGR